MKFWDCTNRADRLRSSLALLVGIAALSCASRTARAPRPQNAAPPADRGFTEVVKGATAQTGLFTVWRRRERAWLELRPADFDRPFLLAIERTHGIGQYDPWLSGNTTGAYHVAVLRRLGNQVHLLALNVDYTAHPNTPEARAVSESFSDSLLAAAPVVGTPHPQRQSVLVDANALFISDIASGTFELERAYHHPYNFDGSASSFTAITSTRDQTIFGVSAHFRLARIPVPALGSPAPRAAPPDSLVDYRSLFLGYQYRMAALPAPYARRHADDRIGHFVATLWDYTDDRKPDPRVHYVSRWRLEKVNPAAAQSPPRRPIVFWIDANVPTRYRDTVRAGILAWNAAFERLGFKDAIQVRQAAPGVEPDRAPLPNVWVHWFMNGNPTGSAWGSMIMDPRTGEILHAHISLPDEWARRTRGNFVEDGNPPVQAADPAACSYALAAAGELDFAVALLDARGELEPDSPQTEALVQARLKEVVMHEAGHTLGLRHNFRASASYDLADLDRRDFTREHGVASSVMDYIPVNLAPRGHSQGDYTMGKIGPYDEWAIEYAYKPIPAGEEVAELSRIASRSSEPGLTYGDDTDAGFEGDFPISGGDPEVNRFDLGSDTLGFSRRRLTLSRELWDRLAVRELPAGEENGSLRRAFNRAFGEVVRAARVAAKYVGGVTHVYDHAGSSRKPFTPLPASRQREALALLREGVFSTRSFQYPPALLNRPTGSRLETYEPDPYRLNDRVTGVQSLVLDHLLSAAVAGRLLDLESHYASSREAFSLAELHEGLRASIWSELGAGGDILALRRSLQANHLAQLVRMALHPLPGTPADARALARADLRALEPLLRARLRRPASPAVHAHLQESLAEVTETLRASLQIAAP